jgi:hypothetical protein
LKRFLRWAAVSFVAFIAGVASLNLWVDPYRIWSLEGGLSPDLPRPRAIQEGRLLKSRGIARVRPVTVILGNSRAEIGFDPRSDAWPEAAQPVYNAALPGTALGAIEASLEQAIAAGRLQGALIGLDFLDFLTEPNESITRPATTVLASGAGDIKIALSLDTLLDSLQTLAHEHDPDSADVTALGFNPLHEYKRIVRAEGYGSVFRQRDQENARAYARMPKSLYRGTTKTSAEWQTLQRIVALARKHRIELTFVIYPYHAHILEMFYRTGLYPLFEQWKKQVVEVVSGAGQRDSAGCRVWDFSGYNAYSTQFVPPPQDRTTIVKSYWESGHFKRELGDRMLARMFEAGDPGFGTCLVAGNVDEHNARLREARANYLVSAARSGDTVDPLFRPATP